MAVQIDVTDHEWDKMENHLTHGFQFLPPDGEQIPLLSLLRTQTEECWQRSEAQGERHPHRCAQSNTTQTESQ